MNENTVTKKQIGKVTYFICSSPSNNAKDTLDKKIEKLIIKDIRQNAENGKFAK